MQAAAKAGLDLTLVRLPGEELRDLYERDLVLIRPDHVVAWRGDDASQAADVLAHVTGTAVLRAE